MLWRGKRNYFTSRIGAFQRRRLHQDWHHEWRANTVCLYFDRNSPILPESSTNENRSQPSTWPDFQYAKFATADLYLQLKESSFSIMEEVTVCSGRSTIWHSKRKFQVHLSLTKETASVDEVQMMLEQQLGFNVILLDAKHLPVMSRETTKGLFSVKYKKKHNYANY